MVVRARRFTVAAIASHACLPSSVSIIVAKLTEFRVQTASRINEWVPTIFGGVSVFVTVAAMPPVISEGSGAGGGREKAVIEGRVVGLKTRLKQRKPLHRDVLLVARSWMCCQAKGQ